MNGPNKTKLAEMMGVSRRLLYYDHKQPNKDWELKTRIELALQNHPSYGHKRLATYLGRNKKAVLRVMNMFGIKPYRRKGKKYKYIKLKKDKIFTNLLFEDKPQCPNHIWASDFTHIAKFNNKWVYLATILDLFTRKIVGFSILMNHSNQLVIEALLMAIFTNNLARVNSKTAQIGCLFSNSST
ncbi:MAG: DDE-type integrase/transposase/recombinase [bacterium]